MPAIPCLAVPHQAMPYLDLPHLACHASAPVDGVVFSPSFQPRRENEELVPSVSITLAPAAGTAYRLRRGYGISCPCIVRLFRCTLRRQGNASPDLDSSPCTAPHPQLTDTIFRMPFAGLPSSALWSHRSPPLSCSAGCRFLSSFCPYGRMWAKGGRFYE